jgi:hypothetical protein
MTMAGAFLGLITTMDTDMDTGMDTGMGMGMGMGITPIPTKQGKTSAPVSFRDFEKTLKSL